uniref:Unannotated protein n=1 Tax=freshwater metagenome TaxID=449393 RepID=A0A6J5Z8R2_9ZZZZ
MNHLSESLVLALGAAVSPIPLTISILLLTSPDRGRAKAIAFAAGQILALAVISVAAALLLQKALGTTHRHSKASGSIDIVLGVILLVAAARKLLTKPKPKPEKPQKKQRSLAAEFIFGAGLMAVNLETLALVLASIKELVSSKTGIVTEGLVLLAIVLIVTVSATLPPLMTFIFPKQSDRALAWLNDQTKRHSRGISAGFLIVFGAYLLYKGITA